MTSSLLVHLVLPAKIGSTSIRYTAEIVFGSAREGGADGVVFVGSPSFELRQVLGGLRLGPGKEFEASPGAIGWPDP